jgi:hypothetical protein
MSSGISSARNSCRSCLLSQGHSSSIPLPEEEKPEEEAPAEPEEEKPEEPEEEVEEVTDALASIVGDLSSRSVLDEEYQENRREGCRRK